MIYGLWLAVIVAALLIHIFTSFAIAKLRLQRLRSEAWRDAGVAYPQELNIPASTAPDFTYTIGDHRIRVLDPDARTRDAVAGLDAIAGFALKYVKTDVAGEVASIWVRTHETQLQAFGHEFHALAEHLTQLNAAFDQQVIALLPHSLAYWIHDSGIVHLIHSLGSSVHSVGDSLPNVEHLLDQSSANALTDAHFPWITMIVSASYEVHRLWRHKTTLARALGHVMLDITFVWGGIAFGGFLGGATGGLIISFLAIPGIGWIAAAATVVGSLAGALLGRRGAKKLKHLKFERMCQEYARAAADLDTLYLQVKALAEAQSLALSITFNARHEHIVEQRDLALAAANSDWNRYLNLLIEPFDNYLKETLHEAKGELEETTRRLSNYPMSSFVLSPKGWQLVLRSKRLQASIVSFETANAVWRNAAQHDVETLRTLLSMLMERDPADLIVFKILPLCQTVVKAQKSLIYGLKALLEKVQTTLQEILTEFSAATNALDQSIQAQLNPSFLSFQELNTALIREADMIGQKVNGR